MPLTFPEKVAALRELFGVQFDVPLANAVVHMSQTMGLPHQLDHTSLKQQLEALCEATELEMSASAPAGSDEPEALREQVQALQRQVTALQAELNQVHQAPLPQGDSVGNGGGQALAERIRTLQRRAP
eukprot:1743266-Prymnesium_polylepis.1